MPPVADATGPAACRAGLGPGRPGLGPGPAVDAGAGDHLEVSTSTAVGESLLIGRHRRTILARLRRPASRTGFDAQADIAAGANRASRPASWRAGRRIRAGARELDVTARKLSRRPRSVGNDRRIRSAPGPPPAVPAAALPGPDGVSHQGTGERPPERVRSRVVREPAGLRPRSDVGPLDPYRGSDKILGRYEHRAAAQ